MTTHIAPAIRKLYTKECVECHVNYEAKHNKSRFCSIRCKNRYSRPDGSDASSVDGEDTIRNLVSSVAGLKVTIMSLTERIEALERGRVECERIEINGERVNVVNVPGKGGMSKALEEFLNKHPVTPTKEPQRKPFSKFELSLFTAYDEAVKKGGAQTDSGWADIDDLPKPEGYDNYKEA